MAREVENGDAVFRLDGTEFTTSGSVRQFDRLAEGFLLGKANRVVDSIASASGYTNSVLGQKEGVSFGYRVRQFNGSLGPVTLETNSKLYTEGRDFGFMLRLWGAGRRIPALAVVEYMLGEETSEQWKAASGAGLRTVPKDQEPATRPLAVGDTVHGDIEGPLDDLVVAMSRDLALAIENPEVLRAHVESVPTETHI